MSSLSQRLRDRAHDLGFSALGIIPACLSPHLNAYLHWIEIGMHGTMQFLAREDRLARRKDLNLILPDACSLIVVALDYPTLELPREVSADPFRGRVSSYAWGMDYHDVMLPQLKALAAFLETESNSAVASRVYVDTGAILERSYGALAGLGFIGKNTMLIHPKRGSFFFLGEIITTLNLEDDNADTDTMPGCGACTRCLDACPTGAFVEPYVLDARRCISYLSIEYTGFVDPHLRPLMGNWVYGCDICQDVCPWQRFVSPVRRQANSGASDYDRAVPPLPMLLSLTAETFAARFEGKPVNRIGRERLVRNACIAAGNSGLPEPEMVDGLIPLLEDESPLVRGHAVWALRRLNVGYDALHNAKLRETHELVLSEMARGMC